MRGQERIPGVPIASQEESLSTGKARGTPGWCHHSQSPPHVSVHFTETCFPCIALALKPRIDSHNGGMWDSPLGKPRGKASWERLEGKPQIPYSTRREARYCSYSSGGKRMCMRPLQTRTDSPGETPEVPKIHVSNGEESSGSGTHSTQDLRPRHHRERNPERPLSNSHGDWPFLRKPVRAPEVPIVSREHLPQLEKIQEVLPSRRDEAHFP